MEFRATVTRYIWLGFFFGLLVTNANVLTGQTPGIENVLMTLIIAIASTGATVAVWVSPQNSSEESTDNKLKRGERVKRLIDLMDEDELYELRKRLADDYSDPPQDFVVLGSDGELHRQVSN